MKNIQQIQSGNIQSFEKVYQEYHTKLYYYAYKHTQSNYLAEETVQLTFIRLWENREKLSLQFEISIQLFRVARSTMIDLLRKERPANRYFLQTVDETADLRSESDTQYKEELHQVETLIEELPPIRKKVFKLSRFEELSHKEIAKQLSISPKTVENHIGRAIRHIKDKMVFLFSLL